MARSKFGQDSRIEIDDPGDWQHFQRLREIADAKREYLQMKREAYADVLANGGDESDVATMVRVALQDYLSTLAPAVVDAMEDEHGPDVHKEYWTSTLLGTVPLPETPFTMGNRRVVGVKADPAEFRGLESILDAPEYVTVRYECETKSLGTPASTETMLERRQIPLRVLGKAGELTELLRRDLGLDVRFGPSDEGIIEEPV